MQTHALPRLLLLLTFLCCLLILPAHPASANDKTLRIGCPSGGWPPFIMPETEPGHRGIMGDLLTDIAAKSGYTVEFLILPEKRIQMYMADGTIDAYPKAMEWVADPSMFRWTDPAVTVEDIVIIRKFSPKSSIPATLLGLNVGVVHGYTYPKLEEYFADGSIRRFDALTLDNLLGMLDHKHVDAIVANPSVVSWTIRNNDNLKKDNFLCATKALDSAPYRFAFTKAWDCSAFVEFFNAELDAMKKDGRFQTILDNYN